MNNRHKFHAGIFFPLLLVVMIIFSFAPQYVTADTSPFIIYGNVTYNGRGMAGIEIDAVNERTGGKISELSSSDGSYTVTFGGPVYTWAVGDTIVLRAKGTGNNECLKGEKEIVISSGEPIMVNISLHLSIGADFSFSPENPVVGENVSFNDLSTGGVTNHTWDFGDGNTSYEDNPVHIYGMYGNYTVSLTIYCHKFSSSVSHVVRIEAKNSNGDTDNSNSTGNNGSTPGFSSLLTAVAMVLIFITFKRRKQI